MILHVQADFEPLLVLRKIPRERSGVGRGACGPEVAEVTACKVQQ